MRLRTWFVTYALLGAGIGFLISHGSVAWDLLLSVLFSLWISGASILSSMSAKRIAPALSRRGSVLSAVGGAIVALAFIHGAWVLLRPDTEASWFEIAAGLYVPGLLFTAIALAVAARLEPRMTEVRDGRISVRISDETRLIDPEDIVYLSTHRNNTVIHLAGEEHSVKKTLRSILSVLPQSRFLQIHKRYAVSIRFVRALKSIGGSPHIALADDQDTLLPVGRAFTKDVRRALVSVPDQRSQTKVSGY